MKSVVVYSSKYGSTKKYAEWISDELKCDLKEKKAVSGRELGQYDVIVYGGGLYAGGVNGIDILTRNHDQLKDKKIILFTCGIADTKKQENVDHILEGISKALNDEILKNIKIFCLRGSLDYSELSLKHTMMMKMLKSMIQKKNPSELSDEELQILDTFGKSVDFMNKDSIKLIIEYIKSLELTEE